MFDKHFKKVSSVESCEQLLTNFVGKHHQQTNRHLYLLIDFCQFQYINPTILGAMLNLSLESWGIVTVIATLSSGEGLFGDHEQFREHITNFIDNFGGNKIVVTGFTEEEARAYLTKNGYINRF